MTPQLTLVRPDARVHDALGDDGLTDAERAEFAAAYDAGVGRKSLSAAEREAAEVWRAQRDRS